MAANLVEIGFGMVANVFLHLAKTWMNVTDALQHFCPELLIKFCKGINFSISEEKFHGVYGEE